MEIFQGTSSGSVCVNDVVVQLSVDTLPFGGVGDSKYYFFVKKYLIVNNNIIPHIYIYRYS